MYISAHISYDGKSAEIDFPVSDDLLNDILTESKMPTDTTLPFFVEDIHYPSELSMLSAKDINLDELNFLAKRLDSFTDDELEQFYVASEHENIKTLKELISRNADDDEIAMLEKRGESFLDSDAVDYLGYDRFIAQNDDEDFSMEEMV